MNRARALKVVLVLVGLLFSAGIYPATMALWHPSPSNDMGDTMMMSLYFTLGVFLLIAVRNPPANRSLIAFAAWSSFAHGTVMALLGLQNASLRSGFLTASTILAVIAVLLILLAPAKPSHQSAAAYSSPSLSGKDSGPALEGRS